MKNLLAFTAACELVTGLAMLVNPPLLVSLLCGAEVAGAGVVVSRMVGISLIALGLACWPHGAAQALRGMLTYNALTTLYLGYVGLCGENVGIVLWPAVVFHAVLSILLARAAFFKRTNQ